MGNLINSKIANFCYCMIIVDPQMITSTLEDTMNKYGHIGILELSLCPYVHDLLVSRICKVQGLAIQQHLFSFYFFFTNKTLKMGVMTNNKLTSSGAMSPPRIELVIGYWQRLWICTEQIICLGVHAGNREGTGFS